MQSNNEMKMPGPELFAGNWNHLFGPGRAETQCRIVVDVANDALVAAQAFDGLKWFDLSSVERADLAESLFEVNEITTRRRTGTFRQSTRFRNGHRLRRCWGISMHNRAKPQPIRSTC